MYAYSHYQIGFPLQGGYWSTYAWDSNVYQVLAVQLPFIPLGIFYIAMGLWFPAPSMIYPSAHLYIDCSILGLTVCALFVTYTDGDSDKWDVGSSGFGGFVLDAYKVVNYIEIAGWSIIFPGSVLIDFATIFYFQPSS